MTPEEKRIAIAETCGWKGVRSDWDAALRVYGNPSTSLIGTPPCNQTEGWDKRDSFWTLPDYLNDLNAMHEAEKVLLVGTPKQIIHATNKYTNWLCRILGCLDTALFQFAHATAAQRADAFIATLDLDKSSHEPS